MSTTPTPEQGAGAVNIRVSADGVDEDAIRRLAALGDVDHEPSRPVLLAEVGGEPVAAIGIADGRTVADPRRSSTGILTRLRLQRVQVRMIVAIWGV